MSLIDPFTLKHLPKWRPRRLFFTARARIIERLARRKFSRYALPTKILDNLPSLADGIDWGDTQVTPEQMCHLLKVLHQSEALANTIVVEVGCWRGVTTSLFAAATNRPVIGVDPFIGDLNQVNQRIFEKRTEQFRNVALINRTSGEASRNWSRGPIGMIFIDAVHDYVNVAYDIEAWSVHVVPGGIIALHDTDQLCFAGARQAVFEASRRFELVAHPENLTIFRKRSA